MEEEDLIPGPSRRRPGARSNRGIIPNNQGPPWRNRGGIIYQNSSFTHDQMRRNPGVRFDTHQNNPNNRYNQRSFPQGPPSRDRGGHTHNSSFAHANYGNRQTGNARPRNDANKKPRGVGFLYLMEVANSAEVDIILNVNKKYDALINLLKSPIERPDMYVLIMEIISKVCVSSFDQLKIKFLLDVCNSQYIVYLRNYLMDLPYMDAEDKRANQMYWQKENEFWANLITFCECILNIAPSVAKSKCRSLIEDVSRLCLEKLSENHNFQLPDELNLSLNVVRQNMKTVEAEMPKTRKAFVESQDSEPPDNFRLLSVLPTRSDLLEVKPFIRPNVINGAYRDVEHYLDVQFRLLREDCFGPLRDGLFQFMKEPSKNKFDNIRVYRNVHFAAPYVSNHTIGATIEVDRNTKRRFRNTKWSYSKRFIFGSLLLLTKDNCRSFIAVTVLDRNDRYLCNGQIPVEIMDSEVGDEIYNNEYYTMIESEVYFEPYQHVLRALQDAKFPKQLAMKKYIVDVDINPECAKYLNENTEYVYDDGDDGESSFRVMDFNTWPTREELGLNSSQYEAYKVALTHEFGVIQGPPGTGKTYLGVKIAKTLLQNANVKTKCKMLVVCYTNHALDQFLEALVPFTSSIARIGAQSRNEALEKFSLNTIRKSSSNCPHHKAFYDLKSSLRHEFARLESNQDTVNMLSTGILNFNFFSDNCIHTIEKCEKVLEQIEKNYTQKRSGIDPMFSWLFQHVEVDLEEAVNNGEVYEDSNPDEDNYNQRGVKLDAYKDKNKENDNVCFTLATANAETARLISRYNTEARAAEQGRLHREIARRRGLVRLFLEMRENYAQQNDLAIAHTNIVDITQLSTWERWMLYFQWADNIKHYLNRKMIELKRSVSQLIKEFEESRMVVDCQLLADKEVIGMTTSGAARLRKLIQTLGPPIVIVEEAAEVLEQHIITSLTNKCQHLLLIGDHKQLRPSAAHMRLARHFNIEVSLFERMILNDVHSRRLSVQHRMRPEFAALLTPHIYSDLENHPSVMDFPDVRGVATNLFFFTHDYKELAEEDNASKSNPKEADMVLLLANYIMQQGYDANDVTILAAYSGQMFYLRKERIKYPHLGKVKMTLVDNYQGEESKIILLSLVRNNEHNKIGFLGTENRVCVALSRAREGFYMFGNIDILKKNSDLWGTIDTILKDGGHVGTSLELRCENHRDTTTTISSPEDFEKVPEGGCLLRCDYKLSCGHQCSLICHYYDREHKTIQCQSNCERVCELNHLCRRKCWQECLCNVKVAKEFPCRHTNDVQCHVDPYEAHCPTLVDVKLPNCGHEIKKPCYLHIKDVVCNVPCDHRVDPCGHTCLRLCHVNNDPDHEKYVCRKPCAKAKKGCTHKSDEIPKEHQCRKLCHEDCDDCNIQVLKIRTTCAHRITVACCADVDNIPCNKKCARMLPCNHFCKKKCFQPCGDCDQMMDKVIPDCQHSIRTKCRLEPNRSMCEKRCERNLPCGHPCVGLCKDICDPKKCMMPTTTEIDSPCGHKVSLPCSIFQDFTSDESVLLKHCRAACGAALQCGHDCGGTCGGCRQGRLHEACSQRCGRPNFCGHECTQPCSTVCPPCRKQCEVKCMHSRCTQLCGAPCSSCKEKCGRACVHTRCTRLCSEPCSRRPCEERCPRLLTCSHPCQGFCGEPCPDICKICRPDDFPKDFLEYEFDDDAIFILLEDCGHILESENMENLMNSDKESIGVRTCPFCRKPIINTQRYKDLINHMFKTEINPVKLKQHGRMKEINEKKTTLLKNMEDFKEEIKLLSILKAPVSNGYRAFLLAVNNNKKCDLLHLETYKIHLAIFKMLCKYCHEYYSSKYVNTLRSEMDEQISLMCKYLTVNVGRLSVQQQEDLENELKRVHAIIQLSKALIFPTGICDTAVKEAEKNARSVVLSWKIYNHEEAKKVLNHLMIDIRKQVDFLIEERKSIVKAIGLKAGHWFKCPNGHFYCIGECGGAMQVSTCPECGEQIGGRNHALLSGNRHAGEIDNSHFAAYSEEYNNMANFNLNID